MLVYYVDWTFAGRGKCNRALLHIYYTHIYIYKYHILQLASFVRLNNTKMLK